ncbi:LacI family DNA-binding transcriptional regulator [Cellulomonas iranensis]|uniref:LacI family DNA-binding transcriptional regulator n=1 Tax=Cellulomonas iranensis TaxID=76862 RepID=UPI000B3C2954|nr:LacI family DNA-binding transcriptional regulator [Cellulomonas iranensis]UCN14817.1 LacI family transcriptional regulator [Cellulomonas iranensis]
MAGRAPRGRITLDDVAARAGVSKGTVSKTLNGRSDVAEDTRRRVQEAVAALGYRPSTEPTAPTRSGSLAAVLDNLESPYISHVLQGVLAAADAAGTDLLVRVAPERPARETPDVARAWVRDQVAAGVVGVVGLTLGGAHALLAAAAEADLPFVMVDPVGVRDDSVVSIGATNWEGGRTATAHLLGLGHRRIAWVGGPAASAASRERFHGYAAALDQAGVEVDRSLVHEVPFTVDAGYRCGLELLAAAQPPTGVVCGDDEIAVGVLAAARERGVPVPARLSVVGFDDTPQATWTTPQLTTVHQPLTGMGRMAVETVLALAAGTQPASRQVQLVTTLVERGSTGPAGG